MAALRGAGNTRIRFVLRAQSRQSPWHGLARLATALRELLLKRSGNASRDTAIRI
jgi:hypothetical protein